MSLRVLIIVSCLFSEISLAAQDLSGTWMGVYQRDLPANKRLFYYRLLLKQSNDSLFGICELLDGQADMKKLGQEEMKTVAAYKVFNYQHGSTLDMKSFDLFVGEAIANKSPVSVSMPPFFSKLECVAGNAKTPAFKPLIIYSVLPANDGPIGQWQVWKLSDSPPDLSKYELKGTDANEERNASNRVGKAIFRKKVNESKSKDKAAPLPLLSFNERKQEIQKTIEVDSLSITIELFDNGVVDNDSVSLYLNEELILKERRLTSSAILVKLTLDPKRENRLALFAHNLGDIAPNTAYMLVKCGANQYPVHLSGSLEKNAVVVLRLMNSKGLIMENNGRK